MRGPDKEAPAVARAPAVEARRLDEAAVAGFGDFTYAVIPDKPRPRVPVGDKRGNTRQRTRLRSGKVIDPNDRFLTECLVFDRSESGGRLRVPAGTTLPAWIQFYDDQSAVLYQADVIWRRDRDIGIRFRPFASTARTRALAADMRRRFYAIPD
jgi:hypothetical protein